MSDDLHRRLEWDSNFFGFEIARVDPSTASGVERGVGEARESGVALLYVFVPGDRLDLLDETARRGGRLVDVRVELECGRVKAPTSGATRLAAAGDRQLVLETAARLADQSRFHRDPRISRERVEAMYRIWGRKCLEEGAVALPVKGDGALVGVRPSDGVAHVELVWVDPEARGRGLAGALVATALESLDPSVVRVATQAGNVPALRLYETLGFRTAKVTSILHLWLDEFRARRPVPPPRR